MTGARSIMLRLSIGDPLPGVAYSLQNKKNEPVAQITAGIEPISFDVPVQVADGAKFYGEFVRREGAGRRFVYIAIGKQAGQRQTDWSRRAKIDIHVLKTELLRQALAGEILEARLPGRAKDGGPACATLLPIGGWRAVGRNTP